MRLSSNVREFNTSMDLQQRGFTIAASAKMFHILSDSLYKHKELAIVRELTANAYDAHIVSGHTDRAIELHLPTPLEPFFRIKDYGTGLPEDGIYELYTRYGGSNKTGSDDLVGGFGLGSKSPFAYTDQFAVESRHDGKLMRFHAYMDSHGMPTVAKIEETDTAEPNGLTVEVPVTANREGFRAFADAAARVLPYVPIPYEVNALPQELAASVELPEYISEINAGKDTTIRLKKSGPCHVVMGIVSYPLDQDAFEYNSTERAVLRGLHFDIYAPIGAFDIAASREALSYSKHTKERLSALLPAVLVPVCTELKDQIEAADTIFEAYERHAQLSAGATYLLRQYVQQYQIANPTSCSPILQLLEWFDAPKWKGQTFMLEFPPDVAIRSIMPGRSYRSKKPQVTALLDPTEPQRSLSLHRFYSRTSGVPTLYWKEKHGVVFVPFFQNDPAAEMPALVITGDKRLLVQTFAAWGLDFNALAQELPDIRRASRGAGKRRTVYGSHQYTVYDSDGHSTERKNAEELEKLGNRLILSTHYSVLLDFASSFRRLRAAGLAQSLDPVHAIIPATHNRVAEALVKAGALTSLKDFFRGGPGALDRERAVQLLALGHFDTDDLYNAFFNTLKFTRALSSDSRRELIARLDGVDGLEELVLYVQRQEYLWVPTSGIAANKDIRQYIDITDAEVDQEVERIKAVAQCQAAMGEALQKKYPMDLYEALQSVRYGGDWTPVHDLLVHYLKSP